jgi:hypothetical protein
MTSAALVLVCLQSIRLSKMQVVMAMMKTLPVFLNVMLCSLADVQQLFGGVCCPKGLFHAVT